MALTALARGAAMLYDGSDAHQTLRRSSPSSSMQCTSLLSRNLLVCPLLNCQVAERSHCREGQTNVTKECGRGTCSGQDTPASVEERDEAHLAQLDLTFCNSVISELTMVPTGRCRCSHEWNTLISYTRHFYIVLKSPVTLTVSTLSLIW